MSANRKEEEEAVVGAELSQGEVGWVRNKKVGGWGDGSVDNSACCSFRGLWFRSQNPYYVYFQLFKKLETLTTMFG